MLSSAAHAEMDPSMVCGKPSIRKAVQIDTKDVSAQTWQTAQTTAAAQLEEMGKTVVKLQDELMALDAKVEAKKNETALSLLTERESTDLIERVFVFAEGEDTLKTFASATEAKSIHCVYGDDARVELDATYEEHFDNSVPIFEEKADAAIWKAGRSISRIVFEKECYALIGDAETMCGTMCDDFTNAA